MKITAIKAQVKNENRVSIFIDGKYSFSLSLDQLLEEKIKKNDEVDEARIKVLKKLSDEGKLKQRTLEWVLGRPHSTKEFRDYLFKKQAYKELVEAWVGEFTEKGYLDDEKYAIWFAENRRRKNKSDRAITSELFSKGIKSNIIKKTIDELNKDEVVDEKSEISALKLLIKKIENRPRYQDEQKLITYLLSKGFNYQDIKSVIEQKDDV